MRELQPDKLNVELLRCLSIRYREMRFVQVHVIRLHALRVWASYRSASSGSILVKPFSMLECSGWHGLPADFDVLGFFPEEVE
jgi:hypothetical protein